LTLVIFAAAVTDGSTEPLLPDLLLLTPVPHFLETITVAENKRMQKASCSCTNTIESSFQDAGLWFEEDVS
jgi:hypothetical protein